MKSIIRAFAFIFIMLLFTVCLNACKTSGVSTPTQESTIKKQDDDVKAADIKSILENVCKVELESGSKISFFTADKKIINDITDMLSVYNERINDPTLTERSGPFVADKLIFHKNDGTKNEILYMYNSNSRIQFLQISGQKFAMDSDFSRYLYSLLVYENHDTDIKEDSSKLFSKYNWTINYRINKFIKELPKDLKHSAGEFPTKLYWAYNNEFSRNIGLDYSQYLGVQIETEIYSLREPLPDFKKPQTDARGIILRHDGNIIGAYIDAGRSGFGCSLNRKSFDEITQKPWSLWIKDYINYDDKLEIYLSKKGPEDIIKECFKAMDSHDRKMTIACHTREGLIDSVSSNMDINKLINDDFGEDIIIKAKLKDIRKWEIQPEDKNMIKYFLTVDYEFSKYFAPSDGARFAILEKDPNNLGWRIVALATGP